MSGRPLTLANRFDKSVESVLNGRNAAMFINIECKKRSWDMEFEEVKFSLIDEMQSAVHSWCSG